ncbi:MAG: transglutaminase domain-containing protein [Candidatus Ozemobacteraceae bacterium]
MRIRLFFFDLFTRGFVLPLFILFSVFLPKSLCAGGLSGGWIERFLPAAVISTPVPSLDIPPLPAPPAGKTSAEAHNKGVNASNRGVTLMESGDLVHAGDAFREAVELDPREKAFLNNQILAWKKLKHNPDEILELCRRLIALDPKSFTAPYGAGILLLEQLKKPLLAIPYLKMAHEAKSEDPMLAVTLASAWQSAGYPDQAIELLSRYAHLVKGDVYPMYLLGSLLLERREFAPALRAFEAVVRNDSEGYVREALIRTKFYCGQLQGLAEEIRRLLMQNPRVPNRQSLERILFALSPHQLRLVETISVDLVNPGSLQTMRLLIRQPPSRAGHQKITIEKAEWVSGKRAVAASFSPPDADGRSSFSTPSEFFAPRVSLRLQYLISVEPWLASRGPFIPDTSPDIRNLQSDESLAVNSPEVSDLEIRLFRLPGNQLQNYYQAVGRGLRYKENFENQQVPWIFSHLDACDCTEFASLLAALCLRRSLPARVVTGFLLKSELIGQETNVGHAWTEIFFPDRGWIPADPTLGQNMHWAYFGNLLSDQIYFDVQEPGRKTRVTADLTTSNTDVGIKISSTYRFTLL